MLISFNKFDIFLEILEGKNNTKSCCYDTKVRNNWTLKMSVKFISIYVIRLLPTYLPRYVAQSILANEDFANLELNVCLTLP